MLDVTTIRPPPAARIVGNTALHSRTTPYRLTSRLAASRSTFAASGGDMSP